MGSSLLLSLISLYSSLSFKNISMILVMHTNICVPINFLSKIIIQLSYLQLQTAKYYDFR